MKTTVPTIYVQDCERIEILRDAMTVEVRLGGAADLEREAACTLMIMGPGGKRPELTITDVEGEGKNE